MPGNRYIAGMRFSITKKLVLAFLSLTLLVLIATLGLARWSFERGFLDYVNTLELNRLERLRDVLAGEYVASGDNWASVDQARFNELLGIAIYTRPDRDENSRPDEPPPGGSVRRPPPDSPPPDVVRRRGQSPSDNSRRRFGPATALFDNDNRHVAGAELDDSAKELLRVAVVVDGETVGELRSEPRRQLSSPQDAAFSQQQLKMSWVIGLLALMFATAMSVALARGLLAPIRRMIAGVERLSSGDYSARLQESRNDELGRLMADLDHLGVTLEEERTTRRSWLANISHELRTPLTILSGEIEALRDGIRRFDRDQLASLEQEVERLQFLIDDLYELSVSDVGGLRYKMTVFNLSDTLETFVAAAQNRARDSGVEIGAEITAGVFINGDEKRIDQLLQNLFENSIIYTDAPGRIEIRLSEQNGAVIIEFDDTKPGATPEECEQLFEPLYRIEASRSRRTGGAGLGLAICKNIVEAHRGSITAAPSSSGGLCIRIEIPAANEATNE